MNLRGLVTSLGAGGSLIAAAVCALVLFGGLLVFRGAVDDPPAALGGDITMPGGTASVVASGPAEPAPARAGVAATERRVRLRRTPSERRQRRSSPERPPRPSAPAAPVTGAPAPGGTTPGEGAGSEAALTPPAGTVKRTVRQVRETAEPVVEAAPGPVQPVVDEVVGTVERVGGTVDETVERVGGTVDETVEQVGGTVDETVEQVDAALAPVTGLLPR